MELVKNASLFWEYQSKQIIAWTEHSFKSRQSQLSKETVSVKDDLITHQKRTSALEKKVRSLESDLLRNERTVAALEAEVQEKSR